MSRGYARWSRITSRNPCPCTVRIAADYDPLHDNYQFVGDRLSVFKEAQNAPDRTYSGGGGGSSTMMVVIGGGDDKEDEDEPMPYEVICYRLGD